MSVFVNHKEILASTYNGLNIVLMRRNSHTYFSKEEPHPVTDVFYVEALSANSTVAFKKTRGTPSENFELIYSVDGGNNWRTFIIAPLQIESVTVTLFDVGDRVYIRNKMNTLNKESAAPYAFAFTGKVAVGGKILSLTNGVLSDDCYAGLFKEQRSLIDASNLEFPLDVKLTNRCYQGMFGHCQNLVTGPKKLGAKGVTAGCFLEMFIDCQSLLEAPELIGDSFDGGYYTFSSTFSNCLSLVKPFQMGKLSPKNIDCANTYAQCRHLKIKKDDPTDATLFLELGTIANNSTRNMFENTLGTFKGTPTSGKYYYYSKLGPAQTKTPAELKRYIDEHGIEDVIESLNINEPIIVETTLNGKTSYWQVVHAGDLTAYGQTKPGIILQMVATYNTGVSWDTIDGTNYKIANVANYIDNLFAQLVGKDLLNVIINGQCPTNISTSKGDTYHLDNVAFNHFFLPSAKEIYGIGSETSPKILQPEGEVWKYWANKIKAQGHSEPLNDATSVREKELAETSTKTDKTWWLRSSYVDDSTKVWYVNDRGRIIQKEFYDEATGVSPACVMVSDYVPVYYTFEYVAASHGSIDGETVQTVKKDTDGKIVTAIPDTGYQFVQWSDGILTAQRQDLHAAYNIYVVAEFEPIIPEVLDIHTPTELKNFIEYKGTGEIVDALNNNQSILINSTCDGYPCHWRVVHAGDLTNYGHPSTNGVILQLMELHVGGFKQESEDPRNNWDNRKVAFTKYITNKFFELCDEEFLSRIADGSYLLGISSDNGKSFVTTAVPFKDFFVPSMREVYGLDTQDDQTGGPEGDRWIYWERMGQKAGYDKPTEYEIPERSLEPLAEKPTISGWFTRTHFGSLSSVFANWDDSSSKGAMHADTKVWDGQYFGQSPACIMINEGTLHYYNVGYSIKGSGRIKGYMDQTVKKYDDSIPVTAIADEGYYFLRWSDGNTNATRQEKNVTSDLNFTAEFIPKAPLKSTPQEFKAYVNENGAQAILSQLQQGEELLVTGTCYSYDCTWRVVHAGEMSNYGHTGTEGVILQLTKILQHNFIWASGGDYNYSTSVVEKVLANGFIDLCDKDFVNILSAGTCQTVIGDNTYTSYQKKDVYFKKFFLPSTTELYAVGSSKSSFYPSGSEGEIWTYWEKLCKKEVSGLEAPTDEAIAGRKMELAPGSASAQPIYHSRSIRVGSAGSAWVMNTEGQMVSYSRSVTAGVAPACIVIQEKAVASQTESKVQTTITEPVTFIQKIKQSVKNFFNRFKKINKQSRGE